MSLQERLREGLYDSKGRPRLFYARNYFQQFGLGAESNFKELIEYQLKWREFNEYLVLQKQTESLKVKGKIERETIAVKCSKRGNDVYWRRVDNRLKFLRNLSSTLFDPHGNVKKSNVIFATLTHDINRCSVPEAFETIGLDYNNWIRNLRKKFGRISCFRCWEASKRGYPHIHILMVFHDYEFKIAFSQLKRIPQGYRRVYRIEEKEEFEKSWHSFVDVQAIRELKEGIRYVTKYLRKTKNEHQTQNLTISLCWLYGKRTFAVSGDFLESLKTEIKNRRVRQVIQMDLQGVAISLKVEYVFIGIFHAKRLGIDGNERWKTITDRQILNEILA